VRVCSFVDKKASREVKEDKKLALGVKKKQLKRKKVGVVERAVESEPAAKHGVAEGSGIDGFFTFPPISFLVVFQDQ
jgi:hypothetical protein